MTKNGWLFIIVLLTILLSAFLSLKVNELLPYRPGSSNLYDKAISSATSLYQKRVLEGWGLNDGPCLTNDLMPGWVVDTVHQPRQEIDDLPQNQCAAYLEGRAGHFVELDLKGNVVRVK